jgi:kynurenine formamidase
MLTAKRMLLVGVLATLVASVALATVVLAQPNRPLSKAAANLGNAGDIKKWWPSPWGAEDEAGASNWITPEKVRAAIELIEAGKIYELGRVYESGMPLFGERAFALRIPGTPTGGALGDNQLIYHDDFLAAEIGQVGTQFDGLGHVGIQVGQPGDMTEMRFYNGVTELELASPYGLQKLGIEQVKPLFTRGILIDVAGYKGRMLEAGEEITLADVRGALRRQQLAEKDIEPGDVVLFNTGWGSLWMVDNTQYHSGAPGIGLEVAQWLIQKEVTAVGADTWPVEVFPNPDPNLFAPVHTELIPKHGIFLQENLDLSELAEDEVYQFAYIFVRVPIKGGTGSPGSPIAVR